MRSAQRQVTPVAFPKSFIGFRLLGALPFRVIGEPGSIIFSVPLRLCGSRGLGRIFSHLLTSHSSQGATADRVLVHVDTEQAHEQLINSRLAYVSVSRGRYDAQIYTNDAQNLSEELSSETSKRSALEAERGSGLSPQDGHAQEEASTERVSHSAEVEREQTREHGMEY